jgi:hypothetical protein
MFHGGHDTLICHGSQIYQSLEPTHVTMGMLEMHNNTL